MRWAAFCAWCLSPSVALCLTHGEAGVPASLLPKAGLGPAVWLSRCVCARSSVADALLLPLWAAVTRLLAPADSGTHGSGCVQVFWVPAWARLAGCTVALCVVVGGCRAGAQPEQLPERGLWEVRLQHPHSLPGSCPAPPRERRVLLEERGCPDQQGLDVGLSPVSGIYGSPCTAELAFHYDR